MDTSTDRLLRAVSLAARLHGQQVDKLGDCYLGHCIRVMLRLPVDATDAERVAAVLHDTKEDCGVSSEDLLNAGVSAEAVALVSALTKRRGEQYTAYIERIAEAGGCAARIKMADLADNIDPERLARLPAKVSHRLASKYADALATLIARAG